MYGSGESRKGGGYNEREIVREPPSTVPLGTDKGCQAMFACSHNGLLDLHGKGAMVIALEPSPWNFFID